MEERANGFEEEEEVGAVDERPSLDDAKSEPVFVVPRREGMAHNLQAERCTRFG